MTLHGYYPGYLKKKAGSANCLRFTSTMYVIVHEKMTSIMKYGTKFSGACQCHRMLMSSSGSVAPISGYIHNIHIPVYYVCIRYLCGNDLLLYNY